MRLQIIRFPCKQFQNGQSLLLYISRQQIIKSSNSSTGKYTVGCCNTLAADTGIDKFVPPKSHALTSTLSMNYDGPVLKEEENHTYLLHGTASAWTRFFIVCFIPKHPKTLLLLLDLLLLATTQPHLQFHIIYTYP